MLTLIGLLFNSITAVLLGAGHFRLGGTLLLFSGLFDMLDGALARITKGQSKFGAFLDSLLDRYGEAIIFLAIVYVFTLRHDVKLVVLTYLVALGSLLISYARARAEGLGLECKVGVAPRPERILILGLGLLINSTTLLAALAILALLTHFTAWQRLHHVWTVTRRPGGTPGRESAGAPETG